jgi:hypothetical protein
VRRRRRRRRRRSRRVYSGGGGTRPAGGCAMESAEAVFTPEFAGTYALVYSLVLIVLLGLCGCVCGWLWCLRVHFGPSASTFRKLVRATTQRSGDLVGAPAAYSPVDQWVF